MTTLALDTATPAPSLAVVGPGVRIERTLEPAVGAGRRIAFEIHELLGDAGVGIGDIDRIVVGIGPGGFTGLRIGIATALALGQARHVPVLGVASIEALALGIGRVCDPGTLIVPVIDAKRREVFTGAYRCDGSGALECIVEPIALDSAGVGDFVDAISGAERIVLGGDGCARCEDLIGGRVHALRAGHAAHGISALALDDRARQGGERPVAPLYLRLPDAEVNRLRREREGAGG